MDKLPHRLLTVIAVILFIWALRASEPVTLPLAFALLAMAAVWPLKQRLSRVLPEWLALSLCVAALLGMIGLFAFVLYISTSEVLAQLRSSSSALGQAQQQLTRVASHYDISLEGQFTDAGGALRRVALDGYRISAFLGLIVILVIFGLPEAAHARAKLRSWLTQQQRMHVADSAEEIASKVRRYLGVTLVLSLVTGLTCWGWGYATGLKLAATWGLLNFVLNFIPIIGNIVGIVPPALYAFAQFGSAWALLVAGGFAVIQLVISNLLNPWMEGRSVSLSPFVVILAVAFWGWLWGIGGALIAVPVTSATAIICDGFDRSRWLAQLMARKPDGCTDGRS